MTNLKWTEEDLDNWRQWKHEKDREAGNYLVYKYEALVDYVVHRMSISLPQNVDKDDLKSLGYNGLLDAFEKFELERGLQFETYASWRIKGAIIDGLRQIDWLPRSIREKSKKIEEALSTLEQEKLRTVSDKEISDYLNIPVDEIQQVLVSASLSTMLSIDEPVYDDEDQQIGRYNMIQNDDVDSPDSHIEKQHIKETLAQAIEKLSEKEQLVISLFYFEEMNLTEIAEILSLSTSRISQIHSKAMLKLKASVTTENAMVYYS